MGFSIAISTEQFQPTHPHGVRLLAICMSLSAGGVSTHAPARGATYIVRDLEMELEFQPTHPHGVRLVAMKPWARWF